jgi:hypothetical protein
VPTIPMQDEAVPAVSPPSPYDLGRVHIIPEATVASEIPVAKILFSPEEPPCVGNQEGS